jgi:hypothetical protein
VPDVVLRSGLAACQKMELERWDRLLNEEIRRRPGLASSSATVVRERAAGKACADGDSYAEVTAARHIGAGRLTQEAER